MSVYAQSLRACGSIEGWYLEDYLDAVNILEVSGRSDKLGIIGATVPRERWIDSDGGRNDVESFKGLM